MRIPFLGVFVIGWGWRGGRNPAKNTYLYLCDRSGRRVAVSNGGPWSLSEVRKRPMTSQSPGFVFRYSESFAAMPTRNAPERICWNLSKDYWAFRKIIGHFKRLLPISKDYCSVIAVPDADLCRNREIWNDMQFPFALKRKSAFLAHCMAVSPPFFPLRARKSRSGDCRLLRIDGPDMASQRFDLLLGPFA